VNDQHAEEKRFAQDQRGQFHHREPDRHDQGEDQPGLPAEQASGDIVADRDERERKRNLRGADETDPQVRITEHDRQAEHTGKKEDMAGRADQPGVVDILAGGGEAQRTLKIVAVVGRGEARVNIVNGDEPEA
jgi:hypothetical protein